MLFDALTAHRGKLTIVTCLAAGFIVGGCQDKVASGAMEDVATSVKFDEATYGVPASPRVVERTARAIAKGGGRAQIGKPYKVKGKWYYPKDEPGYTASGMASWYGPNFHGRLTANGETYDMHHLSAAHKTFPLPSYALVTNLDNGSQVKVRVNDRGPFSHGREIDLSKKAAELLEFKSKGVANVKVEYIGRAPLEGDDTQMLLASFSPGDASDSDHMIASNEPLDSLSATAYSPSGKTAIPGVRPMQSLFQNQPSRTGAVIDTLSSFKGEERRSGAAAALETLGAGTASGSERIYLGAIDRDLMKKVGDVIGVGTRASGEATARPNIVSATVTTEPSVDTDNLLRKLWAAGFSDAFVLRD